MNDIILITVKLLQKPQDLGSLMPVLVTKMDDTGQETSLLDTIYLQTESLSSILEIHKNFQMLYKEWQKSCRSGEIPIRLKLAEVRDLPRALGVTEEQTTNYSSSTEEEKRQTCTEKLENVIDELSKWLDISIPDNSLDSIRDRVKDVSHESIRLIFEIEDHLIQELPWEKCNQSRILKRLSNLNKQVNINPVISLRKTSNRILWKDTQRILIVQGCNENINTDKDVTFIKKHLEKTRIYLQIADQPSRQELNELLHDKDGWNAIFYLGHTNTNGTGHDGKIFINKSEDVSIDDLSNAFAEAIKRGLQLLVFNSCDGMGLPRKLSEILGNNTRLPYILVMRREIGDSIAHKFIDRFTEHLFKDKYSVEESVTQARNFIKPHVRDFPGADSLPVLWCNSNSLPLTITESDPITILFGGKTKIWKFLNKLGILPQRRSKSPEKGIAMKNLPRIVYIILAIFLAYCIYLLISSWIDENNKTSLDRNESIGEKSLFQQSLSSEKQEAIAAFGTKQYDIAIDKFEKSLKIHSNDPEARIYLNNALALRANPDPSNVQVIPVTSSATNGFSTAIEVLSGAGLAQIEINNKGGIKGKKVILRIFLDNNDDNLAKKFAAKFVQDPTIKGVVGHIDSNTSIAASSIYQNGGLPMVAPTSSSMGLTNVGDFVFRVVPNSQMMVNTLTKYINTSTKNKKLGFCFDSKLTAGQTFRDAFIANINKQGGSLIPVKCDASESGFSPDQIVKRMKAQGAEGLVLYYHLNEQYQVDAAINLAQAAKSNGLPLYGSHSLIAPEILASGQAFEGMIVVTPRHPDLPLARTFTNKFRTTFGVDPNWREMMGYDATIAIATGLQESNGSRNGLQAKLHDPSFSIPNGSSGAIKFSISGDRSVTPSSAQVQCQSGQCKFVLIPESTQSK
jgi:branched-chain amino acid transport system substrate-binding protein